MNKTILIILLLSLLTSCGRNINTEPSKPVTEPEIINEEITSETTSEAVTTSVSSTISMPITTETQITTAVSTSSSSAEEKMTEITEISEEIECVVTVPTETTSAASTKSMETQTTASSSEKTVMTTVRTEYVTEPPTEAETEPQIILRHDGTDYGKAKAVYDYMVEHGTGTCVNYSYQTMQICRNFGLNCLYAQTPAGIYGHVANAVEVDGKWFVLDAYAECFLTENMCGFTELVDENENFISDASILSSVRYDD